MRIGIIGAGISGLTVAYRLQDQHDITVLERDERIGGHTHTVDVAVDGRNYAIDTGFIVFNERTYPNFIALLNELGVASQPTEMGFSVRDAESGLEYNGTTLNGLFAQRRNFFRPRFYRMIRDILRFYREAPRVLEGAANDESQTVGEYVRREHYSAEFVNWHLLPMGAAIWSCPLGTFAEFPVRFIVEFYERHGLLSVTNRPIWRVIQGGSRTYVTALTKRFRERIRCGVDIAGIRRSEQDVVVTLRTGETLTYDHVIIACHADQALSLLSDPSELEQDVLRRFPYQTSTAVLHTDPSVLPRRRRAWAAWNYLLPRAAQDGSNPQARGASVTYQMNLLQRLPADAPSFNVTLNQTDAIDPQRILRSIVYAHPVFTTDRAAAQARHPELIQHRRTSYCGAYWRYGFHEDGVVSALRVCAAFGSGDAQ